MVSENDFLQHSPPNPRPNQSENGIHNKVYKNTRASSLLSREREADSG